MGPADTAATVTLFVLYSLPVAWVANAPNLVGVSMLRESFPDQTVSPLGLLAAAAAPTVVALVALSLP